MPSFSLSTYFAAVNWRRKSVSSFKMLISRAPAKLWNDCGSAQELGSRTTPGSKIFTFFGHRNYCNSPQHSADRTVWPIAFTVLTLSESWFEADLSGLSLGSWSEPEFLGLLAFLGAEYSVSPAKIPQSCEVNKIDFYLRVVGPASWIGLTDYGAGCWLRVSVPLPHDTMMCVAARWKYFLSMSVLVLIVTSFLI